jgi:hypothetical protein
MVFPMFLSHCTAGVCLRLLATDEGDADSLIKEVVGLARDISLGSGNTGWLQGTSDDE